ncbi:MAG: hypothetical protein AABX33_02205 [Nanoarchaeota archaeon]
MIPQLQRSFHSITKSLEVLYTINDTKPCSRILVFEDGLDKTINFLNQNKIHNAISDFKVVKQSVQSEFYSDKSIKVGENSDQKGYFLVYLSKDKEIAEKAKSMESKNNQKEFGLLLGYPECCCDFFEKNFNGNNTDLTLNVLENSDSYYFSFYNNIAARHFDVTLLSHFPHSFDCKPSIEVAKSNFKTIQKDSPQLATMFYAILQSVVIYTLQEGIFLLKKYEKLNDEIIYDDVVTTTNSKLYYLLSSNKKLRIIDKNSFVVSDSNIKGPQYGVMVFG